MVTLYTNGAYKMPRHGCDLAVQIAKISPHRIFKMGAVIMKGKKVISVGNNQHKTHPIALKLDTTKHAMDKLHAEMHSILRAGTDLTGTTLYVARKTGKGIGMARPCNLCWILIRNSGIKKVVYTNNDGGWSEERVW